MARFSKVKNLCFCKTCVKRADLNRQGRDFILGSFSLEFKYLQNRLFTFLDFCSKNKMAAKMF